MKKYKELKNDLENIDYFKAKEFALNVQKLEAERHLEDAKKAEKEQLQEGKTVYEIKFGAHINSDGESFI